MSVRVVAVLNSPRYAQEIRPAQKVDVMRQAMTLYSPRAFFDSGGTFPLVIPLYFTSSIKGFRPSVKLYFVNIARLVQDGPQRAVGCREHDDLLAQGYGL